jgi:hypothetical protein
MPVLLVLLGGARGGRRGCDCSLGRCECSFGWVVGVGWQELSSPSLSSALVLGLWVWVVFLGCARGGRPGMSGPFGGPFGCCDRSFGCVVGAVVAVFLLWFCRFGVAEAVLAGGVPRLGRDIPWRQEGIANGIVPS